MIDAGLAEPAIGYPSYLVGWRGIGGEGIPTPIAPPLSALPECRASRRFQAETHQGEDRKHHHDRDDDPPGADLAVPVSQPAERRPSVELKTGGRRFRIFGHDRS